MQVVLQEYAFTAQERLTILGKGSSTSHTHTMFNASNIHIHWHPVQDILSKGPKKATALSYHDKYTNIVQWNLLIRTLSGPAILSFVER